VRQKFGLPEILNPKHCFTLRLGSRPEYPRNNAEDLNQNKSLLKKK